MNDKILFLDDHWVETVEGLTRSLHQPKKPSDWPVLMGSYSWENRFVQDRTGPQWVPEEGVWKIWYRAKSVVDSPAKVGPEVTDPASSTCLAVSRDGLNWEKPFLRRECFFGSPENNIVFRGFAAGPIYDAREPDPARRYKALMNRRIDGTMTWCPSFSADGLRWCEPRAECGVVANDEAQILYDSVSDEYRFYCKRGLPPEIRDALVGGRPVHGNNHRSVCLSTSPDFVHWSEPELVFHADEQDLEIGRRRCAEARDDPARVSPLPEHHVPERYYTDVYNMAVFVYEGLYIGMPCMFDQTGRCGNNCAGYLYPELACSRDGRQWQRVGERGVFLPFGPKEDFDSGSILMSGHPVVREDEIWFHYLGAPTTHDKGVTRVSRLDPSIGLAKLRIDGFVSLDAGPDGGLLTTTPVAIVGGSLFLNVDAADGEARVELLDVESKRPLPGFSMDEAVPVRGDHVATEVVWKEKRGLGSLVVEQVQIRISLKQARLFSLAERLP